MGGRRRRNRDNHPDRALGGRNLVAERVDQCDEQAEGGGAAQRQRDLPDLTAIGAVVVAELIGGGRVFVDALEGGGAKRGGGTLVQWPQVAAGFFVVNRAQQFGDHRLFAGGDLQGLEGFAVGFVGGLVLELGRLPLGIAQLFGVIAVVVWDVEVRIRILLVPKVFLDRVLARRSDRPLCRNHIFVGHIFVGQRDDACRDRRQRRGIVGGAVGGAAAVGRLVAVGIVWGGLAELFQRFGLVGNPFPQCPEQAGEIVLIGVAGAIHLAAPGSGRHFRALFRVGQSEGG